MAVCHYFTTYFVHFVQSKKCFYLISSVSYYLLYCLLYIVTVLHHNKRTVTKIKASSTVAKILCGTQIAFRHLHLTFQLLCTLFFSPQSVSLLPNLV